MKKRNIFFLLIFIVGVLLFGVVLKKKVLQESLLSPEAKAFGFTLRRLTNSGGRVAWYHGAIHELIAFDAIVNQVNKNTEIFIMNPDGTKKTCVTCRSATPKGFIGQPAWHPNGDLLIYQAENENSNHTVFNHMSFGINQDLWVIRKDGTGAELVWRSAKNHAALHPHFNNDGTKILFAERVATNVQILRSQITTPGGENPWDGWRIHIADFDTTKTGTDKLSNHIVLFGDTKGFYETHGFTYDGKIIYSHTENGAPYVDDIYSSNLDGYGVENLTSSAQTWEEHGNYSPVSDDMAFISSRSDVRWSPTAGAQSLRTELFIKKNGLITQLTNFNQNKTSSLRFLVSDFDWDAKGTRIVFQVAPVGSRVQDTQNPQIWMLHL